MSLVDVKKTDWMESVRLVFDYFCERTPRSFVESREASIVWNYKCAFLPFKLSHIGMPRFQTNDGQDGGRTSISAQNQGQCCSQTASCLHRTPERSPQPPHHVFQEPAAWAAGTQAPLHTKMHVPSDDLPSAVGCQEMTLSACSCA